MSAANEVARLEAERFGELLSTRRWCYVIPVEAYVEGHGYRVAIAIEGEKGYFPTGSDRALVGDYSNGATMPWFWGENYAEAQAICDGQNALLGYTPEEAFKIVASTMGGSAR